MANDLFDSSSDDDADTDDLIASAKAQPIARKKEGAATKKKKKAPPPPKTKAPPDADNDDSDSDDDDDEKEEEAGLFDSSDEDDDDDDAGPKKKKLGKKKNANKTAAAKKPPKKDTRSMKERMEALARKRAASSSGDGGGGSSEGRKRSKKRSKTNEEGKGGGGKESGYKSGDSYDSETFERTKDDDDFIDADDEDPDSLKELYAEQHFEDERPDEYDSEEERKAKKMARAGRKSSGGQSLDKISLSDDEGGEGESASNALKAAVRRMQRKKKEVKKLPELEEEGMAFLKRMEEAADLDDESIKNRRPALKKLGMLQQVMDMLARKDMTRVLLDLELLSVCKRWIQPLPGGTLGNVTLRRRIMECISGMSGENGVNPHDLKQSGFGKVVMTLYMHKSETPEMKKMLKGTIEQWSRPIFQKSGNMRDLERAQRARGGMMNGDGSLAGLARAHQMEEKREERRRSGGTARRGKTEDDLAHIISKGAKSSGEAGNNRVRVPYSKGFQYSVRPENRTGDVSDKRNLVSAKAAAAVGPGFRESEKRDAISKRMIEKNRKTNKQGLRSANISIEGRAVK